MLNTLIHIKKVYPMPMVANRNKISGFTLVELAIVIVIIGLLVGGVLQGQELIQTSKRNSTLSQIESYKSALFTFKSKYNYLPGDIPDPNATNFGFQTRGAYAGQGDGDGNIQGVWGNGAGRNGHYQNQGETCMVWVDLSFTKLIKGNFDACTPNSQAVVYNDANMDRFLPLANIGSGNHFYIWFDGRSNLSGTWLTIAKGSPTSGTLTTLTGIRVLDAYSIDKKLDDGDPQLGVVNTIYHSSGNCCNPWWSGENNNSISTQARPLTSSSCQDNDNTAGIMPQYSIAQNGELLNCAISYKLF